MLDCQKASGTAKTRLDLVGYEQRPIFSAEVTSARKIAVVGYVHSLALNRFDNECGHPACRQDLIERVEVVERNLGAVRQQRSEPIAKVVVPCQRQRPIGKAVKRMGARYQPGTSGRLACEFNGRFNGLCARIG